MVVTWKEFLSLQAKVDKILAIVSIRHQTEAAGPQSIAERLERLETRECLAMEMIALNVEMGIRGLDNNRTADHKEFLATAECLI